MAKADTLQVSYDNGATWQLTAPQPMETYDDGAFWPYFTGDSNHNGFVPPGTTSVQIKGQGNWRGDFIVVRDISLWSNLATPKPGKSILYLPIGIISSSSPEFQWSPATEATDYELVIYDRVLSEIVHFGTYSASICNGAFCNAIPNVSLASGLYTWLVRALNNGVYGEWSIIDDS